MVKLFCYFKERVTPKNNTRMFFSICCHYESISGLITYLDSCVLIMYVHIVRSNIPAQCVPCVTCSTAHICQFNLTPYFRCLFDYRARLYHCRTWITLQLYGNH